MHLISSKVYKFYNLNFKINHGPSFAKDGRLQQIEHVFFSFLLLIDGLTIVNSFIFGILTFYVAIIRI